MNTEQSEMFKCCCSLFKVMVCLHCQTQDRDRYQYKMACVELCGGVHTAQRQRLMQISSGCCTHFVGICIFSVLVSGSVNDPLFSTSHHEQKICFFELFLTYL